MITKFPRVLLGWLSAAAFFLVTPLAGAQGQASAGSSNATKKRPIAVEDAIRMTRLAGFEYSGGADSKGRVAQFSPDGTLFVIVLKHGNLERNTNEFSLTLFRTSDVFHSPKPDVVLRMSSSSNEDAIRRIRWLPDNKTLVFLGERPGDVSQVYVFNIETRRLEKLTHHPTRVTNYDISNDGHMILFIAAPPEQNTTELEETRRNGIVVWDQYLPDLIAGHCAYPDLCGDHLYWQERGQPSVFIPTPTEDRLSSQVRLSLSPNGRYALVGASIRTSALPQAWAEYKYDEFTRSFLKRRNSYILPFSRYLLVDIKKNSALPLWDAPMTGFPSVQWDASGHSVIFRRVFLPLNGTNPEERERRKSNVYDVEVKFPSREFRVVDQKGGQEQEEEDDGKEDDPKLPLHVTLEEAVNTPPKIYVSDTKTQQKTLVLDLNPQFGELDFGKVEITTWKAADGIEVTGGLYLPPDYVPGKRYPLVIQTHGFNLNRFSMDGLNDWSSGYGARFMAAKGIVVLQTYSLTRPEDRDRFTEDKALGTTMEQAYKKFEMSVYEGAIDSLDQRGLITRDQVGIMGFSRTVCYVGYALTHSKYHFAAAVLVDGISGGYFEYIAYGDNLDYDNLNGGGRPFGQSLAEWLKESSGFNLDKVHVPVRLEAHQSGVLEQWEWFSGLTSLGKPVDFIALPDADHTPVKPWEQRTSQQGAVDWFLFWLKDEHDTDPLKAKQYARWRELRKMRDENAKPRETAPAN